LNTAHKKSSDYVSICERSVLGQCCDEWFDRIALLYWALTGRHQSALWPLVGHCTGHSAVTRYYALLSVNWNNSSESVTPEFMPFILSLSLCTDYSSGHSFTRSCVNVYVSIIYSPIALEINKQWAK